MTASVAPLMFVALFLVLLMGFPVAFSMAGIALVFGFMTFGGATIDLFAQKVDEVASNYILAAVPLFIFMGALLERSGIAERLFEAVHLWTRRLPGGLAVGTIVMCVIFAASSGVIGATEVVVGLLAIPVMMKHGYNKGLISGTICAGGSLGTIIPPSVVVIIMGPIANVSVGDLFVGMIVPGLLMASLYILYVSIRCWVNPPQPPAEVELGPAVDLGERLRITLLALVPPLFLIFAVLGSLILGVAAPTEAAGMGAVGALVLTALNKRLSMHVFKAALLQTIKVTCMIQLIVLAGTMFSSVFIASGGSRLVSGLLDLGGADPWLILALLLFIAFVTGCFLEWISMVLIFIPLFIPIVVGLGFDPTWFCILFLIVIQTSYITPPMAPAIFYLRGISPPEITVWDMYKGIVPFVFLQFTTLVIVMLFPQLVLWLPSKLLGFA